MPTRASMRSAPLAWIVALTLCVLALGALPSSAEARGSTRRAGAGFHATGEYDVIVTTPAASNGAELFFSRRSAAYILSLTGQPRAYLLRQRDRSVTSFPAASLVRSVEGTVSLAPGTRGKRLGTFRLRGNDVAIELAGLSVRLTPRAPLLGKHDRAGLLAHAPQYAQDMTTYRLDEGIVQQLAASKTPVEIEVYFGSWCPRCQQLLRNVLRLEEALIGSNISFSYYGLPKPPAAWREAQYKRSGVRGLPGAVVRAYGRSRGVIDHRSWSALERQLLARIRS